MVTEWPNLVKALIYETLLFHNREKNLKNFERNFFKR